MEGFVESYDLVILTADEPLGVGDQYLTGLAKRHVIKLITAGYFHSYLKVSYIVGGTSPSSAACLDWTRNPWFIGPSFGPTNTELAGQVSSLAFCNDPVKFCSGDNEGEITDEHRNERRHQALDS